MALAAAVTPIMEFDVAVATISGTFIKIYITGTLMGPPPMPEQAGESARHQRTAASPSG